jgi:hypothetical protein
MYCPLGVDLEQQDLVEVLRRYELVPESGEQLEAWSLKTDGLKGSPLDGGHKLSI